MKKAIQELKGLMESSGDINDHGKDTIYVSSKTQSDLENEAKEKGWVAGVIPPEMRYEDARELFGDLRSIRSRLNFLQNMESFGDMVPFALIAKAFEGTKLASHRPEILLKRRN